MHGLHYGTRMYWKNVSLQLLMICHAANIVLLYDIIESCNLFLMK